MLTGNSQMEWKQVSVYLPKKVWKITRKCLKTKLKIKNVNSKYLIFNHMLITWCTHKFLNLTLMFKMNIP